MSKPSYMSRKLDDLLSVIKGLDRDELEALCLFSCWTANQATDENGEFEVGFPEDNSEAAALALDMAEKVNEKVYEKMRDIEVERN